MTRPANQNKQSAGCQFWVEVIVEISNTINIQVSNTINVQVSHARTSVPSCSMRSVMILKSFGNEKNKQMLRDVVAQGPSKSRRIKNVYDYFFPRAMLMLRETAC